MLTDLTCHDGPEPATVAGCDSPPHQWQKSAAASRPACCRLPLCLGWGARTAPTLVLLGAAGCAHRKSGEEPSQTAQAEMPLFQYSLSPWMGSFRAAAPVAMTTASHVTTCSGPRMPFVSPAL